MAKTSLASTHLSSPAYKEESAAYNSYWKNTEREQQREQQQEQQDSVETQSTKHYESHKRMEADQGVQVYSETKHEEYHTINSKHSSGFQEPNRDESSNTAACEHYSVQQDQPAKIQATSDSKTTKINTTHGHPSGVLYQNPFLLADREVTGKDIASDETRDVNTSIVHS
jgi:hypothetical protein